MKLLTLIDDNNNKNQHINRILYQLQKCTYGGINSSLHYYGRPHDGLSKAATSLQIKEKLNKANFYITEYPIYDILKPYNSIFCSNLSKKHNYKYYRNIWNRIFNENLTNVKLDTQHPVFEFIKTIKRLSSFLYTIDGPLVVSYANKHITEKQLNKLARIFFLEKL